MSVWKSNSDMPTDLKQEPALRVEVRKLGISVVAQGTLRQLGQSRLSWPS